MKFRPLHDRVVVTRIDAEGKTSGGIIIPDTAKERPTEGEVIAVGPGGRDESGKLIPIDLRVGDRVLFGWTTQCMQLALRSRKAFCRAAGSHFCAPAKC
jgi:co-chaperonin GroES (HSP10)